MSDIDYGAVFGVETTGGETESAPAEQTTPAAETTENTAGEKETAPAEQSAEENAKYAAARRKAEQERDAAIAQAQQAAQRSLDQSIAALGQTNPYTGEAITTKAQWDAWKTREAQEKQREVAESAGMSDEEFAQFVNNLPAVANYRKAAEKARQQEQKMVLEEQITAIAKLDPSVKTVADLLMPVEAEVIEFNKNLEDASAINNDPYGEGWIIKIKPCNAADVNGLMDAAAYTAKIGA